MYKKLSHWFIPHTSNNHRAKILHHSSILFFIFSFFIAQFLFSYIRTDYPAVLGSSINLSTEALVQLTNQEREKHQLPPLTLNDSLSVAAGMKADYMLANNFWAHNGPDGTTPWYFFKKVGYNYVYAGENLARGFTDSSEVMAAWMNSPTHKENILSPNYDEVGFAIKKGELLGEDTTLIVEMFGSTAGLPSDQKETASQENQLQQNVLPAAAQQEDKTTGSAYPSVLKTTSLISSSMLSSGLALFVLGLFIVGLFVDLVVINRKKIVRIAGHNIDHIFFFIAILCIVLFSTTGHIL